MQITKCQLFGESVDNRESLGVLSSTDLKPNSKLSIPLTLYFSLNGHSVFGKTPLPRTIIPPFVLSCGT